MLRGVNLGPHHRIKMDVLRELYESLGLVDVCTYVQSGNVVFRTKDPRVDRLAARIESAIDRKFGFTSAVSLRTAPELRQVIANNPFAKCRGIDPSRLLVTFLAKEPAAEARAKLSTINADPEEIHLIGRELYIYYPNGLARPKVPWIRLEKMLEAGGTARNWNTVTKLLGMAEELEQ